MVLLLPSVLRLLQIVRHVVERLLAVETTSPVPVDNCHSPLHLETKLLVSSFLITSPDPDFSLH